MSNVRQEADKRRAFCVYVYILYNCVACLLVIQPHGCQNLINYLILIFDRYPVEAVQNGSEQKTGE